MQNTERAHRAQLLALEAMQERDPAARAALAKRAIMLWPECADAYNILAADTMVPTERLRLYETACAKAAPAIADYLKDHRGMFWRIQETRPYMRALHGRAETLFELGHLREAADLFEQTARLDEHDTLGAFTGLAKCLVLLDEEPPSRVNFILYGPLGEDPLGAFLQALYLFRRVGNTATAKRALTIARRVNRFVVPLLLKHRMTKSKSPGDEVRLSDAVWIAGQVAPVAHQIPGATEWLQSELERKPNARTRKSQRLRKA